MATVYDYIKINKGIIAVVLNCESMLKYFEFTSKTAELKTSLENAVEECLATCVVDTLLQYDESTIKQFINTLRKTDQVELIEFFTDDKYGQFYGNKKLHEYTSMEPCETPIPIETKRNLQLNYDQISNILYQNAEVFIILINYLMDKKAISCHMRMKCRRAYHTHNNVDMFLDTIINEYQYTCLKEAAIRCDHELKSDLVKYL